MKYLVFLIFVTVSILSASCSVDNSGEGISKLTNEAVNEANKEQQVSAKQTIEPAYQPGDEIPAAAYIEHKEVYNPESVIPPQCYTKTDGVNNPCYVCHQTATDPKSPNFMYDGALQGDYQFSDVGMSNSWKNLFKDRREDISAISDEDIESWVVQDNYSDWLSSINETGVDHPSRAMILAGLAYPETAFDEQGFALDGSHWVAYNYKPFPSAFWPTNGATGDAMIRLGKPFREVNGLYQRDIYLANLSLVELAIKQLPKVTVPDLDETIVGEDLNRDGELSIANVIYPRTTFVGDASEIEIAYQLYPEATEFLHTVRYLGVSGEGKIYNAPRMKELRYMRKHKFKSAESLKNSYYREAKEKEFEQLPKTISIQERGIDNSFGWTINAYIENEQGELREQVHQELAFCNGCHKTVGSTIDQVFSFARKVDGADGWAYFDLNKMQDVPNVGETKGEYLTYFERVNGGDEFRQNREILSRWFDKKGDLNARAVESVDSLYDLITPSPERAKALNKSYRLIVKEQSYIYGRDAVLQPATNVLETVDDSVAPLQADKRYVWDMRLNWGETKPSFYSAK